MEVIDNPRPNVYTIRYTSTHGFGDSSIRIFGTTGCGLSFESTRVMSVLPPAPTVTLTSTPGETCGAILTATFTGTPPFSGTWWDGQTFTTDEYTMVGENVTYHDPNFVTYKMRPEVVRRRMSINVSSIP